MEPVDLCDVAVEAIDELGGRNAASAGSKSARKAGDAPMLAPGRSRRAGPGALINLIGNAVKYSPDGSVIVARRDGAATAGAPMSSSP